MKTQDSYPTVSSPHHSENSQNVQTYSVVDEGGELIGQVERIFKNDVGRIQILFSLSGQSKPVFKVHQKSILKVDLENHRFIIKLTDKMRQKLNQYSAYSSESLADYDNIPSVDYSENEEDDSADRTDELYNQNADGETIRLLAERLDVKRDRKKIGEVVVRKQVETEIIEVPVRREKLIIEKAGETNEPLAEIDISSEKVREVKREQTADKSHQVTVKGEFTSLKAAADLLEAISMEDTHGCAKVRVELVLDDPQYQEQYQNLLDRCTNS